MNASDKKRQILTKEKILSIMCLYENAKGYTMAEHHIPPFAYDYLKQEINKYYKKQYKTAPQERRVTLLSNMRDALFGLETLSDPKIHKLVEMPQAYFYILHHLPIPNRLKHQDENTTEHPNYFKNIIERLSTIGSSARKAEKFRNKVHPYLIAASLLFTAAAVYAEKTQHNYKPAVAGAVVTLATAIYHKKKNDILPPYPKTPDLTR